MIPDIVCDDLPEILFVYRGVRLIKKAARYEITENGQLLAVAKVPAVAERLFFYRALAIASADEQAEPQRAAFTTAGRQVYFSAPPEAVRKSVEKAVGDGDATVPPTAADTTVTSPDKGRQEENNGEAEGKKRAAPFKKPTVEEIDAYCAERGNGLSGQAIYDHYEANGWMVGRTKMKDWKAAVRTWEHKERVAAPAPRNKAAATNPEQSSLDNQALETALLTYRPVFGQQREGTEHTAAELEGIWADGTATYLTDLRHPVMREEWAKWKLERGNRPDDPPSTRERRDFDRLMVDKYKGIYPPPARTKWQLLGYNCQDMQEERAAREQEAAARKTQQKEVYVYVDEDL